ncbi:S23A2-like protein [Mya arenaria]|uniref:S23A2-like protein n=1 Tax=Mya arenaria TaxID=6604 RepID=A0ABY7FJE2_MYAAR|nr:S23A2-like protein [Mya arenaria]
MLDKGCSGELGPILSPISTWQAVISIAHQLVVSLLVAEVVCASNDSAFKARLLSSTLFMTGLTTLLMVTLGVRLPLFQGAAIEYLSPLLLLGTVDSTFCTTTQTNPKCLILQGSLMVAGAIHTFVGFTGLVGVLLRFIGPMTIIPAVLLIASVTLILTLYLGKKKTPLPNWNRKKGFHILWYPLHQVFAILIGMFVGTVVCAIFTAKDVIPFDECNPHFRTRTDARIDVLEKASWFYFPYPGQFGPISFSSGALVGCLLATMLSILDSVGDYFACARACHVPPPPRHAVNRGLGVEGLCTFFAGAVGCGHATTTYAGNIGVILSNLSEVSLSSTRNLAILGLSITIGIMVPHFIEEHPEIIDTDNIALKNFLKMFFGNANFAGTKKERGILAWSKAQKNLSNEKYLESSDLYKPWLPTEMRKSKWLKFLPFLPEPEQDISAEPINRNIDHEEIEIL